MPIRFALDAGLETPLYAQIVDQVRYAVSVGALRAHEALPSVRVLERELGVNRNTIRRGYQELVADGTLIVRQGKQATIAPRRRPPSGPGTLELSSFASRTLQDAEVRGLDGIALARRLADVARRHDELHPKCAFVECSGTQAADFARAAAEAWGRTVLPLDLHEIEDDPDALPPSVRLAFTTCWHIGRVQQLLQDRAAVAEVTVRLSSGFHVGIERLRGLEVGLLLRDEESTSGYRQLVTETLGVAPVAVALVGDEPASAELLRRVDGVVYTTNCREFVRRRAPRGVLLQELEYEPHPRSLAEMAANALRGAGLVSEPRPAAHHRAG